METKLTTVFGWWDWEAETPALVNRVTGERLAFRGTFADPELVPSDESWLRFDYLHEDLTFPLLVQERPINLFSKGIKTVWALDYEKSAILWRRKLRRKDMFPGYGMWRRVDDCVTDALACWPTRSSVQENLFGSVEVRGGWLNGKWSAECERSHERLPELRLVHPTPTELDPWLIPLDAPPPSPWVFHPFRLPVRNGESVSLEAQVLLDGLLIERKEQRRLLRVPADSSFDELEGRTAYLLTEDGRRVLYPMEGDTDPRCRGGHSSPKFRLLYADEDIVCDFSARAFAEEHGAARWKITSLFSGFGLRLSDGSAVVGDMEGAAYGRPSRRLWLRLQWMFFDAWSQWRGTEVRSSLWLEELHLFGAEAVWVAGGYRGGELINNLGSTLVSSAFLRDGRKAGHV